MNAPHRVLVMIRMCKYARVVTNTVLDPQSEITDPNAAGELVLAPHRPDDAADVPQHPLHPPAHLRLRARRHPRLGQRGPESAAQNLGVPVRRRGAELAPG